MITRAQCTHRSSGLKLQRNGIHAVPGILGCQVLTFKDVAEMPATSRTDNLNTPAIGIRQSLHCSGYLVIKCGPATTGIEFVIRTIKLCIALTTDVDAGFVMFVVFPRSRIFCAFVQNYAGFCFGEFIQFHNKLVSTEYHF